MREQVTVRAWRAIRVVRALVLVVAGVLLLIVPWGANAQSLPDLPQFRARTENDFPRALTFELRAQASRPIVEARLYFRPTGASAWTSAPVPVERPARDVRLSYEWFTGNAAIPPGLLLEYYWRLWDQEGETLETPRYQVEYLDARFDWQRVEGEKLVVLWYAGDRRWGEAMFQVGRQAIERLEREFGITFGHPIRVVVYGNRRDFRSAFPPMQEWVGGQAFPQLGVTVQFIAPGNRAWMEEVLAHEVAHLAFARATERALVIPPDWLTEGVAMMLGSPQRFGEAQRERLRQAARDGRLPRLSFLQSDSFGADHQVASLAYLASWGLVDFLWQECGREGFQELIAGLNAGLSTDEALEAACGYDQEALYARWLAEELGVTPTPSASQEGSKRAQAPTPPPDQGEPAAQPVLPAAIPIPPRLLFAVVAAGCVIFAGTTVTAALALGTLFRRRSP
ncbi:MAG: peptidase MA family metallohydrolase [Ardenticatenia bacterium]|nr:peptidase MA family metallohydrolase [Ardenticatenia bacterium]